MSCMKHCSLIPMHEAIVVLLEVTFKNVKKFHDLI